MEFHNTVISKGLETDMSDVYDPNPNVQAIMAGYPKLANHPMYSSRTKEFQAAVKYHEHYGRTITEYEFDWAISLRFGGGCEYEWPCD